MHAGCCAPSVAAPPLPPLPTPTGDRLPLPLLPPHAAVFWMPALCCWSLVHCCAGNVSRTMLQCCWFRCNPAAASIAENTTTAARGCAGFAVGLRGSVVRISLRFHLPPMCCWSSWQSCSCSQAVRVCEICAVVASQARSASQLSPMPPNAVPDCSTSAARLAGEVIGIDLGTTNSCCALLELCKMLCALHVGRPSHQPPSCGAQCPHPPLPLMSLLSAGQDCQGDRKCGGPAHHPLSGSFHRQGRAAGGPARQAPGAGMWLLQAALE